MQNLRWLTDDFSADIGINVKRIYSVSERKWFALLLACVKEKTLKNYFEYMTY